MTDTDDPVDRLAALTDTEIDELGRELDSPNQVYKLDRIVAAVESIFAAKIAALCQRTKDAEAELARAIDDEGGQWLNATMVKSAAEWKARAVAAEAERDAALQGLAECCTERSAAEAERDNLRRALTDEPHSPMVHRLVEALSRGDAAEARVAELEADSAYWQKMSGKGWDQARHNQTRFKEAQAERDRLTAEFDACVKQYDRECDEHTALRDRIQALAERWDGYPIYGPVDGTGRHDPNGWDMFDVPKETLMDELRALPDKIKRDDPWT